MNDSGKLWSPSPARVSDAALTAFAAAASRRAGRLVCRLCRPASLVDRGPRRLLDPGLGILRRDRRARRTRADRRRQHAGRLVLSGCDAEFRRKPAGDVRTVRRDRLSRRRQGRAAPVMGRIAGAGLAPAAGDARARREEGRPGGGDAAEHARGDCRHAGCGLARRDLVVLLAGFRRRRRARPLWPDRAGAVHRLRRLLVQWQAERRLGQGQGGAGAAAQRAQGIPRRLSAHRPAGRHRHSARGLARRRPQRFRRRPSSRSSSCPSRIRSTSCFPPAPPAFPNASCIRPAAR